MIIVYICWSIFGIPQSKLDFYLINTCNVVMNDCMYQNQRNRQPIEDIYKTCIFLNRESLLELSLNDHEIEEQ